MQKVDKREMEETYQKRARNYDWTSRLYYLLGFREMAYRKQAIASLALKSGASVVDIGCGTGLNFPLFERAIGAEGKITGIDLTDAMLAQAQRRIQRHGWKNVRLIHQDAATAPLPQKIDAVFASFALTAIPEYEAVVANAAKALKPGGRMVIMELKRPSWMGNWLMAIFRLILRPFGVKPIHATFTPWRSMEKHFGNIKIEEFFFGAVYIAESTQQGSVAS